MPSISKVICLGLGLLLASCASYPSKVGPIRSAFEAGDAEGAINSLKTFSQKKDSDELLYLLELAMAYHASGNYTEAIRTFHEAEKLSDATDYTSITQEAASVALNDTLKKHKIDQYEKVLLSMYLAVDYTLLGDWESALVECRRLNHKLAVLEAAGELSFQKNAFAKYLAALLFENRGEYNDAWVDYKQAKEWAPQFPYHGTGLIRMAEKLRVSQELASYRKEYPEAKNDGLKKDRGDLVVLVEVGRAPFKQEDPNVRLVPVIVSSYYGTDYVEVDTGDGTTSKRSYPLFDIEATAIRELEERRAAMVAKKIAGIVAKEAAAAGIGQATKNKNLGLLSSILLHLTDRPDLRSWMFLPANLQIVRTTLPVGKHTLAIDKVNRMGEKIRWKQLESVEIKPSRITFVNLRSVE